MNTDQKRRDKSVPFADDIIYIENPMRVTQLCHCDKTTGENHLRKEGFVLTHDFRVPVHSGV
jgi:hypothetical protein